MIRTGERDMTAAGRIVLVTGAGGGLGRAICHKFHACGDTVIATDYSTENLARPGERMIVRALDVTDQQAVDKSAAQIRREFGRLDVLVNNAGIIAYFPVAEMPPDEVIRHFEVNAFAALRTTHACLDLLANAGGRVINISSESWRLRTPFQIYQSTKLALEGISDVLRRELAHLGIAVATIRPGAIDTPLFHAMTSIRNPVADSRLASPFARFAAMLSNNPPARRSTPEDVAALVYRAATNRRCRPHYQINNMTGLKLASWLPDRLLDRLLRHKLGRDS